MWGNIPRLEGLLDVSTTSSQTLPDETLFLYLVVSDTAVTAALIQEDGGIQKLVYYVSKALIDAQTRYTRIEKLVLALFITVRKLKHYLQWFHCRRVDWVTAENRCGKSQTSNKITKWVTKIRPLGVTFELRTLIKGQILADFIVKFTPRPYFKTIPWNGGFWMWTGHQTAREPVLE